MRTSDSSDAANRTLVWLPVGLTLALVVLALFFRRYAAVLRQPVEVASDASENSA